MGLPPMGAGLPAAPLPAPSHRWCGGVGLPGAGRARGRRARGDALLPSEGHAPHAAQPWGRRCTPCPARPALGPHIWHTPPGQGHHQPHVLQQHGRLPPIAWWRAPPGDAFLLPEGLTARGGSTTPAPTESCSSSRPHPPRCAGSQPELHRHDGFTSCGTQGTKMHQENSADEGHHCSCAHAAGTAARCRGRMSPSLHPCTAPRPPYGLLRAFHRSPRTPNCPALCHP